MSEQTFAALAELARQHTGIHLEPSKRMMLTSRLLRRLRALGLESFEAYLSHLETSSDDERQAFANAVSTNLTYFFREPHHFDQLGSLIEARQTPAQRRGQKLRLWCTASSSGEEPYSIAIALAEAGLQGEQDYRLLCTDLNSEMVALTQAGEFNGQTLRGLSPERQQRWFERTGPDQVSAGRPLRAGMICRSLNLFHSWPIRAGVDVVFCRNTLIYFQPEQQLSLIRRFAELQPPGAFLFLGHSESIPDIVRWYERAGNTVFRRKDEG